MNEHTIPHLTVNQESVFGARQYVVTLHTAERHVCRVVGTSKPTAAELPTIQADMLRNLATKRTNFVEAN